MKIVRYVLNVFLTLLLAVLLARYVANLPYEWPWLTSSIRWVLLVFNVRTYDNPDDMFDLASVVIFFASLVVVGVIVWAANVGARRFRRVVHH